MGSTSVKEEKLGVDEACYVRREIKTLWMKINILQKEEVGHQI